MVNSDKKYSFLFLCLTTIFITCLLLSNLIAGKLILVFGMVLPAAVILFPITYIVSDIITEVYGFGCSRRVIWTGFACNLLAVLVYMATIALPYPDFWFGQEAFGTVLGSTPRILVASLLGYLFGEFLNAMVLSRLKVLMKGKWLWGRTIASSVIGVALDTLIFITVAFWGIYDTSVILNMILFQYIWKLGYEVVLTPVVCFLIKRVKVFEGSDVYDVGEKYNPFKGKN